MKERRVIRDPAAFQLLADETRMKIIYMLRANEMTVGKIAAELTLTPQTIYHHIKKLREAEMVEVSREERSDHLVESYFRATAGVFHFVDNTFSEERGGIEIVRSAMDALRELGFELETSEKQMSAILKLKEELTRNRGNSEILEKIYNMDNINPITGEILAELAMMMKMSDHEFEKYIDTQRTLREFLLSKRARKGKS